jgi:hypothetical protein
MLQGFPTLVVVTIANEGAKPGVYSMLRLLPLVHLEVYIGQTVPYTKVATLGLRPYQSSIGEQPPFTRIQPFQLLPKRKPHPQLGP